MEEVINRESRTKNMRIKELEYWINYSPSCSIPSFTVIGLWILTWEAGTRIIPILISDK